MSNEKQINGAGCNKVVYPGTRHTDAIRCGNTTYNAFHKTHDTVLCDKCRGVSDDSGRILQQIGEILEVPAGHQHRNLPNVLRERLQAQNVRSAPDEIPAESAVNDQWLGDVVDFLHLLVGDLSDDNRLVALTARQLIVNAPRLSAEQSDGVWHDWIGGDLPVHPNDSVEVRFRDGTDSGKMFACDLDWSNNGHITDIVAWRRVN